MPLSGPLQPRRSNADASPSASADPDTSLLKVVAALQCENAALREQAARAEALVSSLRAENAQLLCALTQQQQQADRTSQPAFGVSASDEDAASDEENFSPSDRSRAAVAPPLTAAQEHRVFRVLSEREMSEDELVGETDETNETDEPAAVAVASAWANYAAGDEWDESDIFHDGSSGGFEVRAAENEVLPSLDLLLSSPTELTPRFDQPPPTPPPAAPADDGNTTLSAERAEEAAVPVSELLGTRVDVDADAHEVTPSRPVPAVVHLTSSSSSASGVSGASAANAEPTYAATICAEPAYAEPATAEPAYAEPAESASAEPATAEPASASPAAANAVAQSSSAAVKSAAVKSAAVKSAAVKGAATPSMSARLRRAVVDDDDDDDEQLQPAVAVAASAVSAGGFVETAHAATPSAECTAAAMRSTPPPRPPTPTLSRDVSCTRSCRRARALQVPRRLFPSHRRRGRCDGSQ
jgi:hypothetical protein